MAQPVYLPKLVASVDAYADPNTSVVQQASGKRNAFGGTVFEHSILPNNSGGSVGVGQGAGASNAQTYDTNDEVLPSMALVYNSFGGTATINFSDAVASPLNQTNFVGISQTATQTGAHNWIKLSSNVPIQRMFHIMVYIPNAHTHLVHGGLSGPNALLGDTNFWNGQAWTPLTSGTFSGGPSNGRYGHAATCDTKHHSGSSSQNPVIVFGGSNGDGLKNDTWWYDSAGWGPFSPSTNPTARVHAAMAFHEVSGLTILFGGYTGSNVVNGDTWKFDISTFGSPAWTKLTPANSPSARMGHCMCYDPIRERIVLFGGTDGYDGYNTLNDTWEWNGTTWTPVQFPTNSIPPSRMHASMAYDKVNKVIVLFGGYQDPAFNQTDRFNIYSDVWYYDGSSWTQQLFFGPSARLGAGMTFDASGNYIMLFGGSNGGSTLFTPTVPFYTTIETNIFADHWELLTLRNQVDIQVSGDGYVYWDATGVLSVAPGSAVRANDNVTVTIQTTLPHDFSAGDKFIIENPADPNFSSAAYTVLSVVDNFHFTYTNFGTPGSNVNPLILDKLTSTNSLAAAEVPHIQRFLGPGSIPGTVTTNGIGNTGSDGLSPIFGIVSQEPVKNSTGELFLTLIGNDRVGLVKMHIGAFYGFITGFVGQISSFFPNFGTTGTEISIVGAGFNTTTAVTFTGFDLSQITAQFRVVSSKQLLVTVPNGAQSGSFTITTSIGAVSPVSSFTIKPEILSLTATSHAIGQQITLTGTTFSTAAGPAGSTTLPAPGGTPSSLSFTGTGSPIVLPIKTTIASGSNGQSLPQSNVHVSSTLAFPPSGIIYVTTTDGYEAVTYTGTSGGNTFTGCSGGTGSMTTGNFVMFTFTVVDDQNIHVVIPPGAITGPVTLGTPDGYTSINFAVLAPPTISNISPLSGASGTSIAITGTGFTVSGGDSDGYGVATLVANAQSLSVSKTVYNDTTMTITAPSLPGGQGSTAFNVKLVNDAGTISSGQQFTIVAPPLFLNAGTSGSANTTSSGTTSSSTTTITVSSTANFPSAGSFFIENEQVSYTGKNSTQFTGCTRGINGTTPASHANGSTTRVLTFISDANNTQGVAGTVVRIFAQYGLTGVSSVSFGSFEAASIHFVNDGYITATVPSVVSASDVTGPITVITTGGIANTSPTSTYPNTFTIEQTPTITSFTNPGNLVGAQTGKTGDTVYITGTNLLGVTSVTFAGMVGSTAISGGTLSSGATTVAVSSTSGFFAPGVLQIENEQIFYTAIVSNTFTGCVRGYNGTTAASHVDTTTVTAIVTASFTVINSTTISVTVPASSSGITQAPSNGVITIQKGTFFSTSSSQNFTYYPPPTGLTVSSPAQDTGGDNFHANGGYGTPVSLTGTDLNQGGSPYVVLSFGGTTTFPLTSTPSTLTGVVPTNANNGLTLTTAGGTTSAITFNILKPVQITNINTGLYTAGQWYATPFYPTVIEMYGANFRDQSHMTITVTDPARGNATIAIPSFTFHDAGHVTFTAAALTPFANYDVCSITVTTFYPGGSYTYTLSNSIVIYLPIT